jgi:hypothetical protein
MYARRKGTFTRRSPDDRYVLCPRFQGICNLSRQEDRLIYQPISTSLPLIFSELTKVPMEVTCAEMNVMTPLCSWRDGQKE